MCYAVSTGPDPFGPYYRYEFLRPLFPDYPRPAIWPDGYYIPTSTGDDVIQKHACVVDRAKMLKGEAATEQCVIIDGVNFLNNADIDGKSLPPPGAPNIMMAAGGTQLVYLVLFSYAFFFKGLTGLAITIGAIATLFVLMQATARIKWNEVFAARPAPVAT